MFGLAEISRHRGFVLGGRHDTEEPDVLDAQKIQQQREIGFLRILEIIAESGNCDPLTRELASTRSRVFIVDLRWGE